MNELTKPQTIMVVEDDADISDAIASTLEDHGYLVMVAANGQEALEKLRDAPALPNLILLDLMMPVMDGWQFRAAQTNDLALAALPVVVLSARADIRTAADEMSAVAWLRKPVDLNQLLNVVSRLYP